MGSSVEKTHKEESVLSTKEMDVLTGLVKGLDYKGVADKLFISPHFVCTHITKIYQKPPLTIKTQADMMTVKTGSSCYFNYSTITL